MDKEAIVKEAKSWIGTPWKHGVSLKGWGTDCAQLLISIGKNMNLIDHNYQTKPYTRDWALHNSRSLLVEQLEKFAQRIELNDIQEGDILVFKYGLTTTHTGIYIGKGRMIHADIRHGVVEEDIKKYTNRFDSVWRLK